MGGDRMQTITIARRVELAAPDVNSMHEFRQRIFVRRLKWSLPMLEGTERDDYDDERTVYCISRDANGHVTACARLLPTTGPYMLRDLFPQLLGSLAAPNHPAIWELSRFAINIQRSREGPTFALSASTLELLNSILEFAGSNDVKRLLMVTSIGIERLMLRSGLNAHRLAAPSAVNGDLCVALFIEVPPRTSAASIVSH